ncbi:hypothetical protein D0Z00_003065 [Geotrichum galactomycetum]|uniref:Uncharacterized protein n=1 Tax=Geotrichum galactomycetum TaxID=27317 RepID=A0ACB6V2E7_9ASCO|nr:hypothetical protein D0Z00_003065 [Geotrichum candidum]
MTYSCEYDSLLNHPYTQILLQSGAFDVDHPYDVEEDRKAYSLTAGTLAGTGMIAHTPLTLMRKESSRTLNNPEGKVIDPTSPTPATVAEYIVIYHLGSKLCGHKDIIHGGLLATLLDESLCRCGFPLLPNKLGVTASLNIKYIAPTPADSIVVLHAWATKLNGRKVTVNGTLSTLGDAADDVDLDSVTLETADQVFGIKNTAAAEALVIEPRWVAKLQTGHFTPPPEKAEPQAQA